MKKCSAKLILCILLIVLHLDAYSQQCTWASTGVCSGASAIASAVSTDRLGNIYIAGSFNGDSMTIGSYVIYNPDSSSSGVFVAKYEPSGILLWVRKYGGINFNGCNYAAADPSGNFYIYGNFSNSITFGDSTFISSYTSLFVTKLNTDGNVIWARHIWGIEGYGPGEAGIAVDNTGTFAIAGSFDSTVVFDSSHIINRSRPGMFVAKYDSSGRILWIKDADAEYPRNVAVDNFGNTIVTGYCFGSPIQFDSVSLATSTTGESGFLVKYNGIGNCVWAKGLMSNSVEASNVAIDAFGNVFNTGFYFGNSLTIGASSFPNPDTSHEDIFISKYDYSGNPLWVRDGTGPGNGHGYPFGIITNANGDVFLSGRPDSFSIAFGTHSVSATTSFLVKFTGAGDIDWIWNPDTGYLEPISLTLDNNDNLLVAGDTGPPMLKMEDVTVTLPPSPNFDMIIAKFDTLSLNIKSIENINNIINIYPNPTTNILNLSSETPISVITMYNSLGEIVYSQNFHSTKIQVDISLLQSGNYVVRINRIIAGKFTKK